MICGLNLMMSQEAGLLGAAQAKSIHAYTGAGRLSPAVRSLAPRVCVPSGKHNTVSVIAPRNFQVISTMA